MKIRLILLFSCLHLLNACSSKTPPTEEVATPPPVTVTQVAGDPIAEDIWQIADGFLAQAGLACDQLTPTIDKLLAAPTLEALEQTRIHWLKLQQTLEPLALFLKLNLFAPTELQALADAERALLAWPISPGALDRFAGYDFSGVVFDIEVPLTEASLRGLHQQFDSEEALLGLYPLAYELFGVSPEQTLKDLTPVEHLSEEDIEAGFTSPDELPNNRRRALVQTQSLALQHDLAALQTLWRETTTQSVLKNLTEVQLRATMVAQLSQAIAALAELSRADASDSAYNFSQFQQLLVRVQLHAQLYQAVLPYLTFEEAIQAQVKAMAISQLKLGVKEANWKEDAKTLYQNLNELAQLLQGNAKEEQPI